MRKSIFVLFILFSLSFADKQPFTISDLYKIKNVSDPQISPDGNKIVFTVTEYFLEKGTTNSDLFLIDINGGNLRQLTQSEEADYHPRWSDDGRTIFFLSSRSGKTQVWSIAPDGGEARQVTDFSMGIDDMAVMPNSKACLFVSKVFPECGADSGCNEKLQSAMDEGAIQAHLADDLMYRHWDAWLDGKFQHLFLYDADSSRTIELTPGEWHAPYMVTGGGHAGFDVSPDGAEVCVTSNRDSNHWETTNKDLWIIPVTGGEPKNITSENPAYDGEPQYSPDGRYVAFLQQSIPNYESDVFNLAIYDRRSGSVNMLTAQVDNWVDKFSWSADSRSIYFLVQEKGRNPLYQIELKSGKISRLLSAGAIAGFSVTPDGRTVVVSRSSIDEPKELWKFDLENGEGERLTFFNQAVEEQVDLRPAEEYWIESPTGKKIHTFLIKPHDFDPTKKYPIIINVHGGPQSQWMDSFRGDWQVYPGAGYVLAFPNPHGSTGYGQGFTHAISKDWGGKVYLDVMAVTDSLARVEWIDEERMGAMGWSYGGYMMAWLQGHTNRFKAIVSMMGLYNLDSFYGSTEELWFPRYDLGESPWSSEFYNKWSPHRFAENFKTPCLVITGEKDFRVSYTQSLEFFTALQKQGIPSRLVVFKNDGHWPNFVKSMPLYYNAHLDWFSKYLGGKPAPWDVKAMVQNQIFKNSD